MLFIFALHVHRLTDKKNEDFVMRDTPNNKSNNLVSRQKQLINY